MSIVKELELTIRKLEGRYSMDEQQYWFFHLSEDVLNGKYGTEIMLDYLDLLGGDSVAFVAKYAAKGIQDKPEVQLDLFDSNAE